jgi:integrase
MLKQLWHWAMNRGYLPMEPMTPWDRQGPSKKQIKKSANKRRPFKPDETAELLKAGPVGSALGDVMRIALSTGARLEEIAGVDIPDIDRDGGGYWIREGKTDNAARYVPLISVAQDVIQRRLETSDMSGPLFSELKIRSSTGKRGSILSQKFTRLRRKVLGEETDGQLVEHSFRHTWRTAARRAAIDELTIKELGGWDKGDGAEHIYDHGLEKERYQEAQQKIVAWLVDQGYFDVESYSQRARDEQSADNVPS